MSTNERHDHAKAGDCSAESLIKKQSSSYLSAAQAIRCSLYPLHIRCSRDIKSKNMAKHKVFPLLITALAVIALLFFHLFSLCYHHQDKDVIRESFHYPEKRLTNIALTAPDNTTHAALLRKVVIIIPYFGQSWPPWFPTFLSCAGTNKDVVDWVIFYSDHIVNYIPLSLQPSNVQLIPISTYEFAERLLPAIEIGSQSRLHAVQMISSFLRKYPYVLVEFKPMLGMVFGDFINESYSHWGYGDIDIFLGNISQIVLDASKEFDVINFTFGDRAQLVLEVLLSVQSYQLIFGEVHLFCTNSF